MSYQSIQLQQSSSQALIRNQTSSDNPFSTGRYLTFGTWVKWNAINQFDVLSNIFSPSGRHHLFLSDTNRRFELLLSSTGSGTNLKFRSPTNSFNTNEWVYIAISLDCTQGTMKLYRKYVGETSLTSVTMSRVQGSSISTLNSNSVATYSVGSAYDYNTHYVDHNYAYTRYWDAQLSEAEILAESESLNAVRTNDLIADWRFNGDSLDSSGNQNDLTEVNSPTYVSDNPFEASGTDISIVTPQSSDQGVEYPPQVNTGSSVLISVLSSSDSGSEYTPGVVSKQNFTVSVVSSNDSGQEYIPNVLTESNVLVLAPSSQDIGSEYPINVLTGGSVLISSSTSIDQGSEYTAVVLTEKSVTISNPSSLDSGSEYSALIFLGTSVSIDVSASDDQGTEHIPSVYLERNTITSSSTSYDQGTEYPPFRVGEFGLFVNQQSKGSTVWSNSSSKGFSVFQNITSK